MDVSTHHRFWRSDFEINKNKNYAIWKMADKNCMQRAKLESMRLHGFVFRICKCVHVTVDD
jgi:hypothetical protein